MKFTSVFRLTCGIFSLILVTGCEDFLLEEDPSNLTSESYFTEPEHADAALAAIYANTRFLYGGAGFTAANFQMLIAPVGIARTENGESADLNNLYSRIYEGDNLLINQFWNGAYRVIGQANMVIERVPSITPMDEARKAKIIGEAKFLRAWAYFYIVRLWGDAPLITTVQTATSPDFLPNRTPQEEIYELIVSDLKDAEVAGLPWMDVTGRVSLAAVKSELAKVFLTMAGYPLSKGAPYYTLAASKAKEVIDYAKANPTEINLFPSYEGLRTSAQNNRMERIFEIQFNPEIAGNPVQRYFLPLSKPITAFAPGVGTTAPTASFYNSYSNGDLRATDQQGYFFTSYYVDGDGELFDLGVPYIFKFFDQEGHGKPGTQGTARSNLNIPQIRYAEVLLIYAEAQNEFNGVTTDAYNALKKIRDRAQLITPDIGNYNQSSFREAVLRERWHELCYEGILWFDMVRLHIAYDDLNDTFINFIGHKSSSSSGQALQERHLLFPLPLDDMRNNPNLKPQNPGYTN